MTADPGYGFDVFLSYCTDPDYRLARRVHSYLEAFHNQGLLKAESLSPLHVCRDGSAFAIADIQRRTASSDPTDPVRQILQAYLSISRYLLVLCSNSAPHSEFVAFEIDWFLRHRGPGWILIAVTEGDPQQDPSVVFPAPILDANLHKRPFYDFRGFRTRSSRQWKKVRDFDEELARVAAHLNNDTIGRLLPLWQQEQQLAARRKRRWLLGGVVTLLSMLFLLLPRGPRTAENIMEVSASEWRLSRDKKLALGFAALPSVYDSANPDAHTLQRAQL
jgi:hypothetical protein